MLTESVTAEIDNWNEQMEIKSADLSQSAKKLLAIFSVSDAHYRETQRQCLFTYSYTARCLGSQSAAVLPCLTQKVEHFGMIQVLYWVSQWIGEGYRISTLVVNT